MTDAQNQYVTPDQLRIGLFIFLDIGWMDHPFPVNSFEIRTQEQLQTLRGLGLTRIRYSVEKSQVLPQMDGTTQANGDLFLAEEIIEVPKSEGEIKRMMLARQQESLKHCERQFNLVTQGFKQVIDTVQSEAAQAKQVAESVVKDLLANVLSEEEAAIRLLSERAGEKTCLHSVNVTIISLLLGKALKFSKNDMLELGLAALLHDVGK